MKISIIGYGSMGKMITEKLTASEQGKIHGFSVANRSKEKLQNVPSGVVVCDSNYDCAAGADILFLCVRPVDLKTVLEDIVPVLSEDAFVISLNGSVSFSMLEKCFAGKMAKVIPSVTAEVDRSQTLVAYNGKVESADKEKLETLLSAFGK